MIAESSHWHLNIWKLSLLFVEGYCPRNLPVFNAFICLLRKFDSSTRAIHSNTSLVNNCLVLDHLFLASTSSAPKLPNRVWMQCKQRTVKRSGDEGATKRGAEGIWGPQNLRDAAVSDIICANIPPKIDLSLKHICNRIHAKIATANSTLSCHPWLGWWCKLWFACILRVKTRHESQTERQQES